MSGWYMILLAVRRCRPPPCSTGRGAHKSDLCLESTRYTVCTEGISSPLQQADLRALARLVEEGSPRFIKITTHARRHKYQPVVKSA
ncbi:hypothetical protein BDW71DRAFT_170672 [Aspergillus fruticulosus]